MATTSPNLAGNLIHRLTQWLERADGSFIAPQGTDDGAAHVHVVGGLDDLLTVLGGGVTETNSAAILLASNGHSATRPASVSGVAISTSSRQTIKAAVAGKVIHLTDLDVTVNTSGAVVSICQDDDGAGTNEVVKASWAFGQYGGISREFKPGRITTAAGKYLTIKVSTGSVTGFAAAGAEA